MRWTILMPLALTLTPALAASAESVGRGGDRLSYVLMTGNGDTTMSSGSSEDFRRAEAFRSGGGPLLYVRDHGAGYVIRDPALLRQAEMIMAPQHELGAKQGDLGNRQGELGRRQGQLGSQMADSTPRQMEALGHQMEELGKQQAALGNAQAALGREQAHLAAIAQPKLRALVAEAIRRGLARRTD